MRVQIEKEWFPGCGGEIGLTRLQVYQTMQPLAQDALEFQLTNEKLRKANHKLTIKGELLKFNFDHAHQC